MSMWLMGFLFYKGSHTDVFGHLIKSLLEVTNCYVLASVIRRRPSCVKHLRSSQEQSDQYLTQIWYVVPIRERDINSAVNFMTCSLPNTVKIR